MVSWSKRRKILTVLLFTGPTIVGILLFNIYPILLSVYTSFTNRNRFRPNPDCEVFLTGILDPLCWPQFRTSAPVGLGQPYRLQTQSLQLCESDRQSLYAGALGAVAAIFLCLCR